MNLLYKYYKVIEFIFLLFLLGTLSFGRGFSILHVTIPLIPLFVTEIFLLFSLPLILIKLKFILKLPKRFLTVIFIYFLFGGLYCLLGILNRNLFVLRDIVLWLYMLFLFLTFIIFAKMNRLKLFLFILVLSNLLGIIVGRCLIFNMYPFGVLENFIKNTKTFNLGLYYGITTSFLISFFNLRKRIIYKIFTSFLLALNSYMLIILGVRTVWVASILLIIFFALILKIRFIKILLYVIPMFIIIAGSLYYLDFELAKTNYKEIILSKAKGIEIFAKKTSFFAKPSTESAKPYNHALIPHKYGYTVDNIIWRLKVWVGALRFGLESFVWGRGFGIYPRYEICGYHEPQGIGIDSGVIPTHNHLISIFYKMGVVGLSLFLFVNIYVFFFALRYLRISNSEFIKCFLSGSLGAFVFWHTMALFFDVIDSPSTSIFLWILIGLIFASIDIDKNYNKNATRT